MPAISGLDVLRAIKENEQTKRLPIVIFSTSSNPEDIQECYRLHANTFLSKPTTIEGLCDVVKLIGQYWTKAKKYQSNAV